MFKNDSYWLGAVLGIIIPPLAFALVYYPLKAQGKMLGVEFMENMSLFTIGLNAVLMRWLLVNKKFDYAGRSVMLVTLTYALIYFSYFYL
jgi:hypothetical protein